MANQIVRVCRWANLAAAVRSRGSLLRMCVCVVGDSQYICFERDPTHTTLDNRWNIPTGGPCDQVKPIGTWDTCHTHAKLFPLYSPQKTVSLNHIYIYIYLQTYFSIHTHEYTYSRKHTHTHIQPPTRTRPFSFEYVSICEQKKNEHRRWGERVEERHKPCHAEVAAAGCCRRDWWSLQLPVAPWQERSCHLH